ncbi:MAG: Holliday junction resolvase RuvX [Chloroflexota bacterium]
MRALALDVGQKNIGVALSDPGGTFAYAHTTIRRTKLNGDLAAIAHMVTEEMIEVVVVGLPRSLSGTLGPQAERVQRFANILAQRLTVPIDFWDERLTTVAAERELRAGGASAQVRREAIDAVAAALILQGYLDYKRNQAERAKSEGQT